MKIEQVFLFGEFRVDPLDRTLRRNDCPVVLNRRAFDVLLYLVQNPGRVVTKEELLKSIWPDAFVDENNLTQSMSVLRIPGRITTLPRCPAAAISSSRRWRSSPGLRARFSSRASSSRVRLRTTS